MTRRKTLHLGTPCTQSSTFCAWRRYDVVVRVRQAFVDLSLVRYHLLCTAEARLLFQNQSERQLVLGCHCSGYKGVMKMLATKERIPCFPQIGDDPSSSNGTWIEIIFDRSGVKKKAK